MEKKHKKATPSFITLINDSKDDNAKARQQTRWASLFPGVHVSFIGVSSDLGDKATLETAGNLVDSLDAGDQKAGIIAVNVAPRGETEQDGDNGSPFAYFWHKKTLVISTIKGYNLSLVKKLEITDSIILLDTNKVLDFADAKSKITKQLNNHISNTQFRSFDFQPRVSKWLWGKVEIPSSILDLSKVPDAPRAVWFIDSFGNLKTTTLSQELHPPLKVAPFKVSTNIGQLSYYHRLKDVPDGQVALYTGSSGMGNKRFLEIAKQNTPGSAQKVFKLSIGSEFYVV